MKIATFFTLRFYISIFLKDTYYKKYNFVSSCNQIIFQDNNAFEDSEAYKCVLVFRKDGFVWHFLSVRNAFLT